MDRFLSIEGGEGSGKTSVISYLKDYLEGLGYNVILTREPGGIPTAEKIREIVLNHEFSKESEMLLFGVCRKEHLENRIKPELAKGNVVICDRYFDSSLVYQGIVGNLGIEKVWEFNKSLIGDYVPFKTFYLDVDAEEGLKRIFTNSDREKNLYDKKTLDYHKEVRKGYLSLIGSVYDNNRIEIIDANKSIEEVREQVLNKLIKLFN